MGSFVSYDARRILSYSDPAAGAPECLLPTLTRWEHRCAARNVRPISLISIPYHPLWRSERSLGNGAALVRFYRQEGRYCNSDELY